MLWKTQLLRLNIDGSPNASPNWIIFHHLDSPEIFDGGFPFLNDTEIGGPSRFVRSRWNLIRFNASLSALRIWAGAFGRSDSELAVNFGSTHSSRRPNLFAPVHPIPPFFVAPKPSDLDDLVSSSKATSKKWSWFKKTQPKLQALFAVQNPSKLP